MPEARSAADSLVFRAISAERSAVRADRQDLPSLDLVGAAIARAARLAAAEDRARRAYSLIQRSQAAELLRAARDAARATRSASSATTTPASAAQRAPAPLFADLAATPPADDGRVIPPTDRSGGFVWRFHPAPADAGAPIASADLGALA